MLIGAINVRNKVSDLQSKLSHAAKQSLDRRFGALYDKIYREDVVLEAWKRVKANKGAPGVDRQDFEYIEEFKCIVLDADIAGFFDNIRQNILLELVERRIADVRVLRLIRMWLEAGVMEAGKHIETNGLGTPQGGVISPMLSNIYLHSFDKMFQKSGIPGTLVRYADDFVILLWHNGTMVRKKVEQMLGRLGLKLHPDKTRVVKAKDGFDFLGVHFRLCPVRKKNSKLKKYCAVWPSDRSIGRIKQRIREVVGRRYSLSLEELIKELTPVIRGWNNYHKATRPVRKRLRKLNGFVRERLRIILKRKYSDRSRGTWRVHNNLVVRLGLYQFG